MTDRTLIKIQSNVIVLSRYHLEINPVEETLSQPHNL